MKDKGFTLSELLGVIAIIAVITIIAFPNIMNSIKRSENKITDAQQTLIFNSVDLFLDNNQGKYPLKEDKVYVIRIQDLVNDGTLEQSFIDSVDAIDNETCIKVNVLDNNKNISKSIVECGE